jgi:hypothetical protein
MFLAELRVLAEGCEFPDTDNMLLGQFVSGISDQELKTQYFRLAETNELTLQDAINRAVARETARAQVAALPQQRQAAASFHKATAYKKLLKGNPPEQKKQVQPQPAEPGSSGGRSKMDKGGKKPTRSQLPIGPPCARPITGDHKSDTCPFMKFECHFCHRRGHIRSACMQRKVRLEAKAHYMEPV